PPAASTAASHPPADHTGAASGSQGATKCPFLAAQLSQENSSVVRKASLALQEDVHEMQSLRKDLNPEPAPSKPQRKMGVLEQFQKPELVSHLLQDNMPKCKGPHCAPRTEMSYVTGAWMKPAV
ncbi:hypothetical protein GDO81_028709, partial [Engystomops pustulosus]